MKVQIICNLSYNLLKRLNNKCQTLSNSCLMYCLLKPFNLKKCWSCDFDMPSSSYEFSDHVLVRSFSPSFFFLLFYFIAYF